MDNTLTEMKNMIDLLNQEYQDLEKAIAKYQEDTSIISQMNFKDGTSIQDEISQIQYDIQLLEDDLKTRINDIIEQRNHLRARQQ